jgi:very-short-patch-repair endonuclease
MPRRIYDRRRTEFLEAQGFKVIRFWNTDVITNLEGVVDTIVAALDGMYGPPS